MFIMHHLLNIIEIKFYYLQQNIYYNIAHQLNNFNISIIIILLISGIFTSINPCLISTIPLGISYAIESKLNNKNKLVFISGLISSIFIVIILTFILNNYCQYIIKNIPILSSIFMILIGLNLLKVIYIQLKYFNNNPLKMWTHEYTYKDYITGFIIGLSSSTCSTPIIITIIFWISYSRQTFIGIIYICCYFIGYILPLLLIVNLTINSIKLDIVNKIWNYTIPFSGSIILGLGIFSLLDKIFI